MPSSEPQPTLQRPALIALAVGIVVVSFLLFSQASLNLSFMQPENLAQTLVLTALSALIFLIFVALTFVLARNLLKLLTERRIGVLGSRFRTRMVVGGLALSFLPVLFMFLFAYVLMNRSIDKWFSRPVEELREDSSKVAALLSDYAATNARAEAITLAGTPDVRRAVRTGDYAGVQNELKLHDASLQGGFVVIMNSAKVGISHRLPGEWAAIQAPLFSALDQASAKDDRNASVFRWQGEDYLVQQERVGKDSRVIVAMPLPLKYSETLRNINESQRRYFELSTQRRQVRRFYMQLLMLITVIVLFASTWLSLFVARMVTRPVSALAEATKEISEGHLEYRVDVPATDELGVLVTSFNSMAAELEFNRKKLEQSSHDLAGTNQALTEANDAIEARRREIETILENVPTGVLSLDARRRVTHSNRAFSKLFSKQPSPGSELGNFFEDAIAFDLERLLRRSDRMGTASRDVDIAGNHLEVTVASLQHVRQKLGYVIVFEDLSEMLKAQKQVAWREVARRVAHEIKNPLTPIALSAERIRRHLERAKTPGEAPPSMEVIEGCADTISGAVETLRILVDEFSTLARFPTAQPHPANLNSIVEGALSLFLGRLDGINVQTKLAPGLPEVMADPEGIKRVVANLVDNAAEAMRDSLVKEINISTALVTEDARSGKDAVEIIVADTGHGITPALKEKLFLPYFSTKERGTGLGLAIVSRIIEEHHGNVRVEENQPMGARFIVELPVAGQGNGSHQLKSPA